MYPGSIDKFTEKLNKIDGNVYVIEEEIILINGVYEGELEHDNVNSSSVRVYTGPKLTGDKIENFILSTPSDTLWKKEIKIFAKVDKCYITYETPGDTVEADDINKAQESIVNTQIEVEKYKASNNLEIGNLKVRAGNLENKKSDKTYVDTELNKRYLKEQVFTKEEVLEKIKNIIGTAPEALDTLSEIANALNNDPDFAGTITKELANKVDKIEGKGLSTENYTSAEKAKLAGIEENANKYIHPASHSADMIIENKNRRFINDTEKTNFNEAYNKRHEHSNKSILDKITQELIDNWNDKADINSIPTKISQLENDKKYITQDDLSNTGQGDMHTKKYDKNQNGKVDIAEIAESVDWMNIENKPDLNKKISKTGDTFTGIARAYPNTSYTVSQIRNIILSPNDANVNAMNDGEIWIKYK